MRVADGEQRPARVHGDVKGGSRHQFLLSRLPAWTHCGALLTRPSVAGGATPMLPKKGRSGISKPGAKRANILFSSSGMILRYSYGKSSVNTPSPGRNKLTA